jgi:hypothetical protein
VILLIAPPIWQATPSGRQCLADHRIRSVTADRTLRRPRGTDVVPEFNSVRTELLIRARSPNSSDGEGDTFASPDERYLISSSRRAGGAGYGDLYVSFRAADSSWGPAFTLGATINTPDHEFCPMVTPDGRYLFFSMTFGGGTWATTRDADVFWVDMAVVERLKR